MSEHGLPGDLILYPVTPRSAFASKLVVIGEILFGSGRSLEEYSHVAIATGHGGTVEAMWPRICYHWIETERPYEVWRLKGIRDFERKRILEWAGRHVGEWYDLPSLLTFGLVDSRYAEVCSTFAGHAYEYAGYQFHKSRRILSPNDIASSGRMEMIYKSTRGMR